MQAVILAGGLGSRLRPFTEIIPKPLLPVGEKSILEIQIGRLRDCGFKDIYLATNYKSEYIKDFFGDGKRLGVNLTISKEEKSLGTCGPLTLLQDKLRSPFIVINGDILTTANFHDIYSFSKNKNANFTVVTKEFFFPFDFGQVISYEDLIIDVKEKPNIQYEIIAGIYYMNPLMFNYMPANTYFGMDNLIKGMLKEGLPIHKYCLKEYWIDIGKIENYEKAEEVYNEHFKDAQVSRDTFL